MDVDFWVFFLLFFTASVQWGKPGPAIVSGVSARSDPLTVILISFTLKPKVLARHHPARRTGDAEDRMGSS